MTTEKTMRVEDVVIDTRSISHTCTRGVVRAYYPAIGMVGDVVAEGEDFAWGGFAHALADARGLAEARGWTVHEWPDEHGPRHAGCD